MACSWFALGAIPWTVVRRNRYGSLLSSFSTGVNDFFGEMSLELVWLAEKKKNFHWFVSTRYDFIRAERTDSIDKNFIELLFTWMIVLSRVQWIFLTVTSFTIFTNFLLWKVIVDECWRCYFAIGTCWWRVYFQFFRFIVIVNIVNVRISRAFIRCHWWWSNCFLSENFKLNLVTFFFTKTTKFT